eukprot:4444892-Amphidinium_carterae.1
MLAMTVFRPLHCGKSTRSHPLMYDALLDRESSDVTSGPLSIVGCPHFKLASASQPLVLASRFGLPMESLLASVDAELRCDGAGLSESGVNPGQRWWQPQGPVSDDCMNRVKFAK